MKKDDKNSSYPIIINELLHVYLTVTSIIMLDKIISENVFFTMYQRCFKLKLKGKCNERLFY